MDLLAKTLPELPANDLNLYSELAQEAGRTGKMEECLEWYRLGLQRAIKMQNAEKIREYSNLILTLL